MLRLRQVGPARRWRPLVGTTVLIAAIECASAKEVLTLSSSRIRAEQVFVEGDRCARFRELSDVLFPC